jgi:hypothetical protein
MKGYSYQTLAKKPQSAFRQKPLNDLQDQSSRRFMPSLWDGGVNSLENRNHESHETSRWIKVLKKWLGSPFGCRPIMFQALHF